MLRIFYYKNIYLDVHKNMKIGMGKRLHLFKSLSLFFKLRVLCLVVC